MTWGVSGIQARYGTTLALDGVDLEVRPGAVTAVVGGDGAGKSTLLKLLSGTMPAHRGTVRRPEQDRIGAVSQVPGVWGDLTVDEHLRFTSDAYALDARPTDRRARRLLDRAGLAAARQRLGGRLSGGMRQKLAVVLALLHAPDLLVLDEPTTGVDPVSRAELWRLVGHAAAEGAAVVTATTYLDEAERAANILVLERGRTLLAGPPQDVTGGRRLEDVVIERQRRVQGREAT